MPPREVKRGSPEEWLARARSNLALAKTKLLDETFQEDLCFNAQQAAEKALKGLLQHYQIPFRYIHDVEELLTTLSRHDIKIPDDIKDATILTEYAVEMRYPGPFEPVTEPEYLQAIALAERIVYWAEKIISRAP